MAYIILVGLHWYVMGACMSSESPELSPRVKRNLPQSFLGRMFLTWFNPGPGTGYILAISGMLAALVMVVMAMAVFRLIPSGGFGAGGTSFQNCMYLLAFGFIGLFYLVIYLGLGLMILRLARRVSQVGVLLAVLVQILLLLVGGGVPLIIQLMSPTMRDMDYSMLQVSSPFWTLAYLGDTWRAQPETIMLLWVLGIAASIVFMANLPSVLRELRHVRIARPQRVAEEDAQLAALKTPPQSTRTSPWDDD